MKVVIYDKSEWAGAVSNTWPVGGRLFTTLRSVDQVHGVDSFEQFFDFVDSFGDGEISELQFWGHGRPGSFSINADSAGVYWATSAPADVRLSYGQRFAEISRAFDQNATFWLRTCSSFHGARGQEFAKMLTQSLGIRCAAHTYLIGPLQSGLHSLAPGEEPYWSTAEGFDPETGGVKWSGIFEPNTVTCLHARFNNKW